jgi:hypothetical protein
MNQRTPPDPTPVAGKNGAISAFAPVVPAETRKPGAAPDTELPAVEPRKSFFRGVAVGIAIMIPIWAWLIIRFLH